MKIESHRVHGTVRLDLIGETADKFRMIRAFIESLNGGPVSLGAGQKNPVFDLPVRIESVGFDDDGEIESLALEGPSCPE